MKSIIYIVCYFGPLPDSFQTWLHTCKNNPTVNWLIVTDDKTTYDYPQNVSVEYISFPDLKQKIQSLYDFPICLAEPYDLCDFKVAYGEIFKKEIEQYDFWGYCDLDMLWGNIRNFLTDEILTQYDKIGFQGHSTLFRNSVQNNTMYRKPIVDKYPYIEAFTSKGNVFFDESGISDIYRYYNIPIYTKTIFANISPLTWSFYIRYKPQDEDNKNKHQIFTWDRGKLNRLYIENDEIMQEEYMYIHFLRRKMDYQFTDGDCAVIYPNKVIPLDKKVTLDFIMKHSKNNMALYYLDLIKRKRNKINLRNVLNYFYYRIKAIKKKHTDNETIM